MIERENTSVTLIVDVMVIVVLLLLLVLTIKSVLHHVDATEGAAACDVRHGVYIKTFEGYICVDKRRLS